MFLTSRRFAEIIGGMVVQSPYKLTRFCKLAGANITGMMMVINSQTQSWTSDRAEPKLWSEVLGLIGNIKQAK
jgi:hypothetical protein